MAKKSKVAKISFDKHELPEEGAVYVFELPDGRYGACRVLRKLQIAESGFAEWTKSKSEAWCVRVSVTPWIGKEIPNTTQPAMAEILTLTHHSWTGNVQIDLVATPPSNDLVYIGNLPLSPQERRLQERCLSFGGWSIQNWATQIVMQWEWDHLDRDVLLVKDQKKATELKNANDQANARRTAKLRKMTLADFRRKKFLQGWSQLGPKPAIAETRQSLQESIDKLIALGSKRTRAKVLAEVKRLILQWNKIQKKYDYFMETTARDDLCIYLQELFIVAGVEDDPVRIFERWEDL